MASLTSLLILAAIVAVGYASHEAIEKAVEKCNEHIKALQSAADGIKNFEDLDDSKEGKCLAECTLKEIELILEDGTLNEEKGGELILKAYAKPETQIKVKEIFESCSKKASKITEPCDHAYEFLHCFIEESHKENLPKAYEEKP